MLPPPIQLKFTSTPFFSPTRFLKPPLFVLPQRGSLPHSSFFYPPRFDSQNRRTIGLPTQTWTSLPSEILFFCFAELFLYPCNTSFSGADVLGTQKYEFEFFLKRLWWHFHPLSPFLFTLFLHTLSRFSPLDSQCSTFPGFCPPLLPHRTVLLFPGQVLGLRPSQTLFVLPSCPRISW